jgi:hypothetical protein
MADRIFDSGWVDRYVCNQLTSDEELEFEGALFDSPALRGDVEAALSLQSLLQMEGEAGEVPVAETVSARTRQMPMQSLAMAASLLVGVIGVSLWLYRASDIDELQRQVAELQSPYSEVSIRRLDVLRSSGATSGHLVRKPGAGGLLVLDVELSASAKRYPELEISLRDASGAALGSWHGTTADRERVTLAIPARQLAAGDAKLEMRADGEVVETWPVSILPDEG